ncbi:Bacillopeptidase F precursor [Rubripirellula amarantea]|uniref:Bacillopeptidase F n=1 Tax=Rubripirellula amarantea TaxID=2527999 RepID=A0A5C5WIA1_9BACT|nr:GEVED domain-containing protein [Rubripirellula amarantea]TWT50458.1 Bacillopeptidase F precursor [Rubripirellula amarantea]
MNSARDRRFSRSLHSSRRSRQSPRIRLAAFETLEPRRLLAAEILDSIAGEPSLAAFESVIPGSNDRLTYSDVSYRGDRKEPAQAGIEILAIVQPDSEFRLVEVKHGIASSHARFEQVVDGIPVYGSFASVHLGRDGEVQTLHVDARPELASLKVETPKLDIENATAIAINKNGVITTRSPTTGNLVWYPAKDGGAMLAWETTITSSVPVGDFHTVVSADTGEVLFKENRAVFATGTGDVFLPNPYQTQGSGSGLADNSDANSAALSSQLVSVTLERLDAGTGLLKGEWVDLSTLNSSTLADVDADEATRVYEYDRDDPRFEQVVIYHAIDSIQAYIHSLGFDDDVGTPNGIRDFPTLANAHWDNDDQSFYSTADDAVHFGDGGVDDGEDADIIAHEYGHAIQHDQNSNWGGGEMGAMGEGFGDYLAASFYAGAGDSNYQSSDEACVGEWDATSYSGSNPPCLRRVDGNKMYPDDLVGQVHADGEIWSAALWEIRAALGALITDQLVLEHHFALPAGATMPIAAQAMLTADANLNGGVNQAVIRQVFLSRGILQATPAGIVSLDRDTYDVGDTLTIEVADTDLSGSGTVNVVVTTDAGDSETITLTESGGTFIGTIASTSGAIVQDNGSLEAAGEDVVTVTYSDADDGTGNPAVVDDSATFLEFDVVFNADFSNEIGDPDDEGFAISGSANQWELSTGRGSDTGHSSDDSFYFGSGEGATGGGSYANDQDGTITSPLIDLTQATIAELSFNHFLESEAGYDFASVSIVQAGTEHLIAKSGDGTLPIATSGFESLSLDISAYVGETIQVAFRFTSDFSITNEGWYVDDVVVRADVPVTENDFGDAPNVYPTTLQDNGAHHLAIGPLLGPSRDVEANGQPTLAADGDGADEDGVSFGLLRIGNVDAEVDIDLQGEPNAMLDAWIDFDSNGTWDASEQIFDSTQISNGLQTLTFAVPETALIGDTYARVRVSSAGDLEPTGFAPDGEVEDYLVTIADFFAKDDVATTIETAPVEISALANDQPSDQLQIVAATSPTNGTLIQNGDGTFTYQANPGFVGTDSFEYTVAFTNAELINPTPNGGDRYGYSVGIDGDYAIVGAYYDDPNGLSNAGTAFVYHRTSNSDWTQMAQLNGDLNSDDEQSYFGWSVAISGDTVVVGAQGDGDKGFRSGAAYIFDRNEGGTDNWGRVAKVYGDDTDKSDFFGRSIDIDSDTVVVGASIASPLGAASGSAYVFDRNQGGSNAWGQTKQLLGSTQAAGDRFGQSVSIDHDRVAVGAFRHDGAGTDSGAAYVFVRNRYGADNWGELSAIEAPDAAAADNFGYSVSIKGGSLAVGAPLDDEGGQNQVGSVYMLGQNTGGSNNWGQVTKLLASDATAGDRLGWSVDFDGTRVITGAPLADVFGDSSGRAYLFSKINGVWSQSRILSSDEVSLRDQYGIGVALDGNIALVGSWLDNRPHNNSGGAYSFDLRTDTARVWVNVDAASVKFNFSNIVLAKDESERNVAPELVVQSKDAWEPWSDRKRRGSALNSHSVDEVFTKFVQRSGRADPNVLLDEDNINAEALRDLGIAN